MNSNIIKGCLYLGAIGDCIGGYYENQHYPFVPGFDFPWRTSDDTQLTVATCESILANGSIIPATVASQFLLWFNRGMITGMGSSTLTALKGLQAGGHWALVGRTGEFAAGNGAAMRIAPLAFVETSDQTVLDVCRITHKNDEACTGAIAILESIRLALTFGWKNAGNLVSLLIDKLADTKVRDRLVQLSSEKISISLASKKYGNTGYVVDSVPLAIYAVRNIHKLSPDEIFTEIINGGGDTDTICSMAGNIMGTYLGYDQILTNLICKLNEIREIKCIRETFDAFSEWAAG